MSSKPKCLHQLVHDSDNKIVLRGGRNNEVVSDRIGYVDFVSRVFPQTDSGRARFTREKVFLNHATRTCPNSVPKVVEYCDEHFAISSEFVPGVDPRKFSEIDAREAVNFFESINSSPFVPGPAGTEFAIEAVTDLQSLEQSLAWRVKKVKELALKRRKSTSFKSLAASVVRYTESAQYFEDKRKVADLAKSSITTPKGTRFLSPSDFGAHNAIRRKNCLVFFDFEYSGFDSGINLLGDILAQPDTHLSEEAINVLIEYFASFFRWDDLPTQSVYRLFGARWLLIMNVRALVHQTSTHGTIPLHKVRRYFESRWLPHL